jgi:hypothetical protein
MSADKIIRGLEEAAEYARAQKEIVHRLKTWARYYDAVADGRKPFEVRRNDRAFQRGDLVELIKVQDESPHYNCTPPDQRFAEITVRKRITYLLQGGQFGIEPGFCVLGLGEP